MVKRNTEDYKPPEIIRAAGYNRIEWDGLDELHTCGLVWVGRSIGDRGRMGPSVSGRVCVTVCVWSVWAWRGTIV